MCVWSQMKFFFYQSIKSASGQIAAYPPRGGRMIELPSGCFGRLDFSFGNIFQITDFGDFQAVAVSFHDPACL